MATSMRHEHKPVSSGLDAGGVCSAGEGGVFAYPSTLDRGLRAKLAWGRLYLPLLLCLLGWPCTLGLAAERSEYDFKAAYLYHFAQLVTWPEASFKDSTAPFVIGILGKNPFGEKLALSVRGKQINGHTIEVKELTSISDGASCHMLFIADSEKPRMPQILTELKDKPVLTISETRQFTGAGGTIGFFEHESKIRFEINNDAAKSAGLKISSRLLVLSSKAPA